MRNTQNGYYTLNQRTVERSKQIFEKHGMKPFTAAHLKAWKDDVLNVLSWRFVRFWVTSLMLKVLF